MCCENRNIILQRDAFQTCLLFRLITVHWLTRSYYNPSNLQRTGSSEEITLRILTNQRESSYLKLAKLARPAPVTTKQQLKPKNPPQSIQVNTTICASQSHTARTGPHLRERERHGTECRSTNATGMRTHESVAIIF
jgi:hypothetical protein